MRFTIEVSDQAHEDVQVIFDYIVERAPTGASRWYEAYQQALDRLEKEGDSYALAPESRHFPHEVRQILFKTRRGRNYRILYAIFDTRIVVLHVRGPGQEFVKP